MFFVVIGVVFVRREHLAEGVLLGFVDVFEDHLCDGFAQLFWQVVSHPFDGFEARVGDRFGCRETVFNRDKWVIHPMNDHCRLLDGAKKLCAVTTRDDGTEMSRESVCIIGALHITDEFFSFFIVWDWVVW